MAQTIKELMELGLSETEAERVINRRAKAEEKREAEKARAEKRLPKAQAELDHAEERVAHWNTQAQLAYDKVVKYKSIIDGTSEGESEEGEPAEPSEAQQMVENEIKRKPKANRKS